MIRALINRRLSLWKNRLLSSFFLLIALPIFIFIIISLPLKNIIRFSLTGIPYEIWVYPGLIFIISSLSMISVLYREYFELRIHGKVLRNISLSPHSKKKYIFSSLLTSSAEALVMVLISSLLYTLFVPISFDISKILFFSLCLLLHNFLLGNLYILIALIIDSLALIIFATFALIFLILFGNGFLIEFSFFPKGLDSMLGWQPLSLPFQIYQKFNATNYIDYFLVSIIIAVNYLWTIINSYILKRKLYQ